MKSTFNIWYLAAAPALTSWITAIDALKHPLEWEDRVPPNMTDEQCTLWLGSVHPCLCAGYLETMCQCLYFNIHLESHTDISSTPKIMYSISLWLLVPLLWCQSPIFTLAAELACSRSTTETRHRKLLWRHCSVPLEPALCWEFSKLSVNWN